MNATLLLVRLHKDVFNVISYRTLVFGTIMTVCAAVPAPAPADCLHPIFMSSANAQSASLLASSPAVLPLVTTTATLVLIH